MSTFETHKLKPIETERLILNKWTLSDADIEGLYAFASNPNVGPNAGWKPHADLAESRKIIENVFLPYHVWSIREKATGRVVGNIGLEPDRRREDVNSMEVGYSLAEDCWGRGYAAEAAWPVIEYAFEEKGAAAINVGHFHDNMQSKRVIEKLGFCYIETLENAYTLYTGDVKHEVLYRMTRDDYNAIKSRRSSR